MDRARFGNGGVGVKAHRIRQAVLESPVRVTASKLDPFIQPRVQEEYVYDPARPSAARTHVTKSPSAFPKQTHGIKVSISLCICASSFFGQMKETNLKCVKIDDMEPAIFEALLYFIYTDSVPSKSELDYNAAWQHLLVAADQYGMDRLKDICQGKLCEEINVQTVATTLALAEQHHSLQLKNACLGYLSFPGCASSCQAD